MREQLIFRQTLMFRAVLYLALCVLVLAGLSIGVVYYQQRAQLENKVLEAGYGLLDSYVNESWDSIAKGQAHSFQIWGEDETGGYKMKEVRPAPGNGGGQNRWLHLARMLRDCRAILVNDLGESPKEMLKKNGIQPVLMAGFIEKGLEAVYIN